jgi:hypothetical protein
LEEEAKKITVQPRVDLTVDKADTVLQRHFAKKTLTKPTAKKIGQNPTISVMKLDMKAQGEVVVMKRKPQVALAEVSFG